MQKGVRNARLQASRNPPIRSQMLRPPYSALHAQPLGAPPPKLRLPLSSSHSHRNSLPLQSPYLRQCKSAHFERRAPLSVEFQLQIVVLAPRCIYLPVLAICQVSHATWTSRVGIVDVPLPVGDSAEHAFALLGTVCSHLCKLEIWAAAVSS